MSSLVINDLTPPGAIAATDFRADAITFKATAAGILATMSHCIEIIAQCERQWSRKPEHEYISRGSLEGNAKSAVSNSASRQNTPSHLNKKVKRVTSDISDNFRH